MTYMLNVTNETFQGFVPTQIIWIYRSRFQVKTMIQNCAQVGIARPGI